ncbi:MAG: SusD/RagB family nutrient-binding outer membrane lipoprotein [Gelidibacter sp.]
MKSIKYIKKTPLILILAFIAISCQDYLDVNTDPNGPSLENLTPEILLAAGQTRPVDVLMTDMNRLGNTMLATWSGNSQQFQTPFNVEFTHQINAGFYDQVWDRLYIRTGTLTQIINFESGENYDYYKASAKILKSFYFQYLVDLYGDIPYTQAHLRGDNLFAEYDNQLDVYKALVEQLNQAIDLINTTDTDTAISLSGSDYMFNGNVSEWKKLAYTVKLKLLVRLMDLADQDGSIMAYLQSEFVNLNSPDATFVGLDENVTVNPGYADETGKMSPFAEIYGYNAGDFGGIATNAHNVVGPTTFLVEFLNGTTTGVVDNRLERFYKTRGGQTEITGNTQGGVGLPSEIGPGLLSSPDQDAMVMSAAEALLLQAEAVQRGYLSNGQSAKSLFEDAIRSSFDYVGAEGADSYIASANNVDKIGWDGSSNKIEAIITQKWIALGGINGAETWIEYTRTGFPANMPLSEITTRTTRPTRLLYPNSEYIGNTAHVSVYGQTTDSAFNTNIFWDVN